MKLCCVLTEWVRCEACRNQWCYECWAIGMKGEVHNHCYDQRGIVKMPMICPMTKKEMWWTQTTPTFILGIKPEQPTKENSLTT